MTSLERLTMQNEVEQERPIWVDDEASINNLLSLLIDKLDRRVRPLIRITKKSIPELFAFNSNDTRYLWSLIESLQKNHHVLEIALERQSADCEVYENAKVRLRADKEATVRKWLNRPKTPPYKDQWITAVKGHDWENELQKQLALDNPISYPGKSAEIVVNALLSVKFAITKGITLRALSARCFWGDSKFLDSRLDYLGTLFPVQSINITPRQLMVNAYVPPEFSSVVLVENQDTFLLLANHVASAPLPANSNLYGTAFVYCAGFRGTASRIRDEGNTAFAFLSQTDTRSQEHFISWWMKGDAYDIQTFFWGDLDYSGLAILAALQPIFPGIQAWKTGYAPMVEYHHKGVHHPKRSAKKENQTAPQTCGCEYADAMLLPLIRQDEYFLDQEVVDIDDLECARITVDEP